MSDWRARLPKEVVACSDAFSKALSETFEDQLVALWFYGAMCFEGSEDVIADIDFHAIVKRPFGPEQIRGADNVHAVMRAEHGWLGEELDGWYVTQEDASSMKPPRTQTRTDTYDTAWALHRAHWHADRVIVMAGPHPATIVMPPTWEEIEAALVAKLGDCESRAGGEGSAFAVLQTCRVLKSLQYRDAVISKKDAGEWALGEEMPAPWHPLIRAAQRRYRDEHTEDDMMMLKERSPMFIEAMKTFLA